ncbi:hypothetical protein CALVIDRAFT_569378 [Calocera viscosa TUFC12733]|uniref:Uncharacterized protein n=1 Tax=Calocera viscosa (strain TUFC12733) TaxID=1330018 RepID=A0A167G0X6_CALVF|nr:hypothetical protein CALVIDRAFT_569378 [Calocera viscosa TUFC12733]
MSANRRFDKDMYQEWNPALLVRASASCVTLPTSMPLPPPLPGPSSSFVAETVLEDVTSPAAAEERQFGNVTSLPYGSQLPESGGADQDDMQTVEEVVLRDVSVVSASMPVRIVIGVYWHAVGAEHYHWVVGVIPQDVDLTSDLKSTPVDVYQIDNATRSGARSALYYKQHRFGNRAVALAASSTFIGTYTISNDCQASRDDLSAVIDPISAVAGYTH